MTNLWTNNRSEQSGDIHESRGGTESGGGTGRMNWDCCLGTSEWDGGTGGGTVLPTRAGTAEAGDEGGTSGGGDGTTPGDGTGGSGGGTPGTGGSGGSGGSGGGGTAGIKFWSLWDDLEAIETMRQLTARTPGLRMEFDGNGLA